MQQPPKSLEGTTITQNQSWKERVQQHLREKWDTELTVALSIAAGILTLFGIVDFKVAIGFILVVFSLVAVNILRNRWANEEMGKTIKDVEDHMPAIKNVADHLPNIKVVAERLPIITEVLVNLNMYSRQDEAEADLLSYIKGKEIKGKKIQEAVILRYSMNAALVH
jgi:hypothetical protein